MYLAGTLLDDEGKRGRIETSFVDAIDRETDPALWETYPARELARRREACAAHEEEAGERSAQAERTRDNAERAEVIGRLADRLEAGRADQKDARAAAHILRAVPAVLRA